MTKPYGPSGRQEQQLPLGALLEAAEVPDAGASLLGKYGLRSAVTVWLLGRAPDLLAERRVTDELGAWCPRLAAMPPYKHRMVLRGEHWACFQPGHPQQVPARPHYPRAPKGDVLRRVTEWLE